MSKSPGHNFPDPPDTLFNGGRFPLYPIDGIVYRVNLIGDTLDPQVCDITEQLRIFVGAEHNVSLTLSAICVKKLLSLQLKRRSMMS